MSSELQIKVDTLENTLKQREYDCENYIKRIEQLEKDIILSNDQHSDHGFQENQIETIHKRTKMIIDDFNKLQMKYFKIRAKKNFYKNELKVARETLKSSNLPSSSDSDSKLNEKIIQLKANIQQLQKDCAREKNRASNYQQKYQDAVKDLLHLKSKTSTESSNEDLINENQSLKKTIETLEEAAEKMKDGESEFIHALESALLCKGLPQIVENVNKLTQVRIENEKLKIENNNLHFLGMIDQNEAYSTVIDSLQQIKQVLSPSELKLSPNSPLKQLFSAIYNMINAASKPDTSKSILKSHIRAVSYQARAFTPENLKTNNIINKENDVNNLFMLEPLYSKKQNSFETSPILIKSID